MFAMRVGEYERSWFTSRTQVDIGLDERYSEMIMAGAAGGDIDEEEMAAMMREQSITIPVDLSHGPIILTARIPHEDLVFGDHTIPRDELVFVMLAAANRDPAHFPDPDRFDVERSPNPHIGFGGGIHFCVGAPLARQELAVSLDGLVARFPDLTLVEEPEYHPTFVIRGLRRLLVTTTGGT